MRYGSFCGRARRTFRLIALLTILSTVFGSGGCQGPPRLTAEDRRGDIEFLAQWAKDYHACVEVNSRVGGLADYEELLPKYMDLAERAETNEEFLQVVSGYFTLIGASGHGYLLSGDLLRHYMLESLVTGAKGLTDIPWDRFWVAWYWARLQSKGFCHAPFRIIHEGDDYFTGEDWSHWGKRIPEGSQIVAVNGMSCSEYKDYLKRETALRYVAGNADRFTESLLVMNEGQGFRGWDVSFRLPNGSVCNRFVPQRKGHPASFQKSKFTDSRKSNCECVELSDEVGYVRIKSMAGRKSAEKKIRRFLEKSQGRYKKLIVDLRHNGGGSTFCSYDALIRPFLDEPLVYKQTSGVKRKLLADFAPELVGVLRLGCSTAAWETSVDEVSAPEGFDPNEWTFHEISREVKPSDRYVFDGDLVVLMDRQSGSATETYLDAMKRTGLATLVGRRSNGALAGYIMPPVMRLPESGMIFRMEADLEINPDGSFNELAGVQPDVELPSCPLPDRADKKTLLKDPWIQAVLNGLSTPVADTSAQHE
jgi:peptidase S41-like protein